MPPVSKVMRNDCASLLPAIWKQTLKVKSAALPEEICARVALVLYDSLAALSVAEADQPVAKGTDRKS